MMRRTSADQGALFDYMQPDGSPALHPPLCACGSPSCPSPVMRFGAQPDHPFLNTDTSAKGVDLKRKELQN